jgi:TRAP transporter TAXI family solute receptor
MPKLLHFAFCIVHCAALIACASDAPQAAPRPVRIVSAMSGGSPFNRTLADVYEAELRGVTPQVVKSEGVVDTIEMLEVGTADVGYSFTNVAYAGYLGELPDQAKPFTRIRAIALLQPAALHVLVEPGSKVTSVEDLRGQPLRFLGPGAAVVLTVESLLPAFGLDDFVVTDDAGGQVVLGSPPAAAVQQAMARGARLLPVRGRKVDKLLKAYPFYRAMVIPADTYEGLNGPVVTIGVNGVLLCRSDLPDDLVYQLTRTLYEGPLGVQPTLARWLEPSAGAATPIPLHPGAARYYRERELGP